MEAKADTSRILMSEALRGQVPELEGEAETLQQEAVIASAMVQIGGKKTAIVGVVRFFLLGAEPELGFKVQLDDAFEVASAEQLQFLGFEVHHGERVLKVPGPFIIKDALVDEIDPASQLCVLSLGLKRPPRVA
jgi:hypothetical protein